MIDPTTVHTVDYWLDDKVGEQYQEQSLAQDWARIAKITEEAGEAIAELILLTRQNPRKTDQKGSYERLCGELADTALTAVYALQHFTKDVRVTERVMREAQDRHFARTL